MAAGVGPDTICYLLSGRPLRTTVAATGAMAGIMGIPKPMAADMNRVRPKLTVGLCPSDDLAGTRTPATTMGVLGQREWANGLRDHVDPPKKMSAPRRPLPKHLRIVNIAPPKRPSTAKAANTAKPTARPSSAANTGKVAASALPSSSGATPPPLASPPPLAVALQEAGLGHFVDRLCYALSASTLEQILDLDRAALDALIDLLRPLPGQRQALLKYVREKQLARAAAADETPSQPRLSASESRNWQTTVAQLNQTSRRGKDGPLAHLHLEQPNQWGRPGDTKQSHGYGKGVHVVTVGRGKMMVFDGPRPNAPKMAREAGSKERSKAGSRPEWVD